MCDAKIVVVLCTFGRDVWVWRWPKGTWIVLWSEGGALGGEVYYCEDGDGRSL